MQKYEYKAAYFMSNQIISLPRVSYSLHESQVKMQSTDIWSDSSLTLWQQILPIMPIL